MKNRTRIHNIDTLEREIYRLKLEAKNIEDKLDNNLDHLQENYVSMTMNSFFCKKEDKKKDGNGFWRSFVKNEGFTSAMNSIAGTIAAKAAEGLGDWINKFTQKQKY